MKKKKRFFWAKANAVLCPDSKREMTILSPTCSLTYCPLLSLESMTVIFNASPSPDPHIKKIIIINKYIYIYKKKTPLIFI